MVKIHLSRILGEQRLSQKRLAEMAGIRPNTVNAIYHEQVRRIDFDVLDRICRALHCQPGDLLAYIPTAAP